MVRIFVVWDTGVWSLGRFHEIEDSTVGLTSETKG